MDITYRYEVRIAQHLSPDPHDPDFPTPEYATSVACRADLERTMLAKLKRLGYDVENIEILDYELDETHDADCVCYDCSLARAADNALEVD